MGMTLEVRGPSHLYVLEALQIPKGPKPQTSPWKSKSLGGHNRHSPYWRGMCPIPGINRQLSGAPSSFEGRGQGWGGCDMRDTARRGSCTRNNCHRHKQKEVPVYPQTPPSALRCSKTPHLPRPSPGKGTGSPVGNSKLGMLWTHWHPGISNRGLNHPSPQITGFSSSSKLSTSSGEKARPSQEPGAPQNAPHPPAPGPEAACSILATVERGKVITGSSTASPNFVPSHILSGCKSQGRCDSQYLGHSPGLCDSRGCSGAVRTPTARRADGWHC